MKKMILNFVLLGAMTINVFASSFNLSSIGYLDTEKEQSGKNKEMIIYKDMLSYLKQSKNANQLMVLGSLLAIGTNEPDSLGEIIKSDPIQAEFYMVESAKMGNIRAYSILGGLFLMNENMRKVDKNLNLSEKYLLLGYENGDKEAGVLLANLYIEKNKQKEGLNLLFELANQKDSNAQLGLALLFKNGLSTEDGKQVVQRNLDSANYYLNLACTNEIKSDKIKTFCFESKSVEVTKNQ